MTSCEDFAKGLLYQWARWARRDGTLERLGYPTQSPEQQDHTHYHQPENTMAEVIEKELIEIGRFDRTSLDVVVAYYVEHNEDGDAMSWQDVARKFNMSRNSVLARHKFVMGWLVSRLRDVADAA